jgi:hypothetical protein
LRSVTPDELAGNLAQMGHFLPDSGQDRCHRPA